MNSRWGKAIALSCGNIFSRCSTALLALALARLLSKSEYGALAYALALATVVSFFGDLGLQNTFLRETAKTPRRIDSLFSVVTVVRVSLVIFFSFLSFIYIKNNYSGDKDILFVVVLGAIGLTFSSLIVGAGLAFDRVFWLAKVRVASSLILLALIIGTLAFGKDGYIFPAYGVALFISGLIGVRSLTHTFKSSTRREWIALFRRLKNGVGGYAFAGMLFVLAPNVGILVLANSADMRTVGLFAIAMKIPAALYAIPASISQSYYIPLSSAFEKGLFSDFKRVLKDSILLSGGIGFLLTILLILLASWFAAVFSRQDNYASIELYGYLCISPVVLLIQSIAAPVSTGLMTSACQLYRGFAQAIACLINCLMLFVLVDRYRVEGALAAAIASEFVYLAIACTVLRLRLKIR